MNRRIFLKRLAGVLAVATFPIPEIVQPKRVVYTLSPVPLYDRRVMSIERPDLRKIGFAIEETCGFLIFKPVAVQNYIKGVKWPQKTM